MTVEKSYHIIEQWGARCERLFSQNSIGRGD